MTVDIHVTNRQHVIVPVRFGRAKRGRPSSTAPDIDHRGWNNPHFSSWTDVQVRGGQVGVMRGKQVRLRVVREYLDASAPLYVTVRRPGGASEQVEIIRPRRGGRLPRSGILHVRGKASTPNTGRANIVEVRLGAASGPVLAECEVRVFSKARLVVQPHVVTVHSSAAPSRNGTRPNIRMGRVLNMAQGIWRQAGVHLVFLPTRNQHIHAATSTDSLVFWGSGANNTIGWMMAQPNCYRANALNAYFIRYSKAVASGTSTFSPLGIGLHRANATSLPNPGIFVATDGLRLLPTPAVPAGPIWTRQSAGGDLDQELANDMAHEIGHYLGLSHFAGVNSPGRDDSFTRRNLMHPNNLMPGPVASGPNANNVRFNDVGYGIGGGGSGHRGCQLTMKRHNIFPSAVTNLTSNDCQAALARMQVFQSAGRPLPAVTLY